MTPDLVYPSDLLDERADELKKALLKLLALYLAGRLPKSIALRRGRKLLESALKDENTAVNRFFMKRGLRGQIPRRDKRMREVFDKVLNEYERLLNAAEGEGVFSTKEGFTRGLGLVAVLLIFGIASRITASIARKERLKLVWVSVLPAPGVCVFCAKMHGKTFDSWDLPDAEPGLVHENCRCRWMLRWVTET